MVWSNAKMAWWRPGAEADLAESHLTDLTREALRHRRALEAGAQILEPMALVG